MDTKQALGKLKALGTAQNRKVYARHGVTGPAFGVSYANLGKLTKQIKVDHDLALGLWKSGNHDARILATMVADPARADGKLLDAWVKDLDSYVITDAFSNVVAGSPAGYSRMEKWIKSKTEWTANAGWSVLARTCASEPRLTAERLTALLGVIERDIHKSKNRVRYAMNNALISIGLVSASLQKKAIAVARRIGVVEVDHGDTGCKTPDAASYIAKAAAHQAQRAKKAKKKATSSR